MRVLVAALAIVAASHTAALSAFNPKPSQVCPIGEPTSIRPMSPGHVLWRVLTNNGLSAIDLGIPNNDKAAAKALLNPGNHCASYKCGEDVEENLHNAYEELRVFWNANAHEPGIGDKFRTGPAPTDTPKTVLTAFFDGKIKAVCLAEKAPDQVQTPIGDAPRRRLEFRVRKDASSLHVRQSQEEAFDNVERASFAFTRDYRAATSSYNFDGVVGLATGRVQLDRTSQASFELIPYVGFTRQYVSGDPDAPNVKNITAGLISHWIIPISGYLQQLDVYPQIVHSHRLNANILTGNVVLTPDIPIFGMGRPHPLYLGAPVSVQFKPQAKFVYGHVLSDGGDMTLRASKDFSRFGPRLSAILLGEAGVFRGWSLRANYEYLKVLQGSDYAYPRFDTTLAFTMPGQKYWALELTYIDGRNLDTLERVRQLTLGLGFKY